MGQWDPSLQPQNGLGSYIYCINFTGGVIGNKQLVYSAFYEDELSTTYKIIADIKTERIKHFIWPSGCAGFG